MTINIPNGAVATRVINNFAKANGYEGSVQSEKNANAKEFVITLLKETEKSIHRDNLIERVAARAAAKALAEAEEAVENSPLT